MKNRTRTAKRCSLLSLLFPTFLMVMFFCTPAYAGSINGNEQSIVSVINGQFEQDGVIYKVRQEYINSAMSYLQQDDVARKQTETQRLEISRERVRKAENQPEKLSVMGRMVGTERIIRTDQALRSHRR